MFQHICLPTDGSQLSRDTAERAVAFAKAAGADITALYAKSVGRAENYGEVIGPDGFIKNLCKDAGVKCTAISVLSETPWEAIVNVAEDNNCDLIFMCKHGRHGISSLLLGSETYRVLTHSNIPVLVYRPAEVGAARRKAKEKSAKKV
jgi:nucleotide-binding universal stress UspA family protein